MVEGLVEDLAISPSQDLERQRVRGTGAVVEEVRDQVPAAWSGCGACTEPGLVVMPTVATKELPLRLTVEEEGVRQASGGEEGLVEQRKQQAGPMLPRAPTVLVAVVQGVRSMPAAAMA